MLTIKFIDLSIIFYWIRLLPSNYYRYIYLFWFWGMFISEENLWLVRRKRKSTHTDYVCVYNQLKCDDTKWLTFFSGLYVLWMLKEKLPRLSLLLTGTRLIFSRHYTKHNHDSTSTQIRPVIFLKPPWNDLQSRFFYWADFAVWFWAVGTLLERKILTLLIL